MKRITQSLFEDIQKITSGQIDEKKLKHDEDGDGDEDAADYMMKRRKAGGQTHDRAHAATRKHNEEVESIEELSKDTLKSYAGKAVDKTRTMPQGAKKQKHLAGLGKAMDKMKDKMKKEEFDALSEEDQELYLEQLEQLDELSSYTKLGKLTRKFIPGQGQKQAGERAKDQRYSAGLDRAALKYHPDDKKLATTMKSSEKAQKRYERISRGEPAFKPSAMDKMKEETEIDEALWPGTPEYEKKFPKDSKPGQRMSKQDYGYRGPSGSETEDKPSSEEGKEKGRGRRKVRTEETIVKHEDFTVEIVNNPTFKDFFDAAKTYVDNDEDAVTVAESFFKNEDTSIIIESNISDLYKDLLNNYEKEGYVVEDVDVTIDEDEAYFKYTLVEKDSDIKRTYVHQGRIIGETEE